ncbi:hypothetical protein QYE76_043039 [Lolium multiflorum]|uniref:Major facilitator superfamily (MFS) profile domain-containing protein n=1 Tax=Lolium multiflorum TaxID=4521 RepID=A0AAD8TGS6_LOLMU|nr:hypothetical protein QYE76_043039 [Lolium multiflorum]
MPAGGLPVSAPLGMEFEAKITPIVVTSCVMAATGGLMFGYDIGVSGGVSSMEDFLREFFPKVLRNKHDNEGSNYCKFNDQGLQLFTSSLYLAGLTSTFFASYTTRQLGRRVTMLIAGAFFIIGVIFNGAAHNLGMLIIGRILLGCGVGFANQAVPLFLSEIAPPRIRGGLNALFLLNITVGILFANLVNFGTSKIHPWGWRLSLSLAGLPALLLTASALFMVDTPNSLIERGQPELGKAVLKKIRGTHNVDPEFNEIVEASRVARNVKHPFRSLLQRRNRPLLAITVLLQMFQQMTGINAIMFYAPVLFTTLGNLQLRLLLRLAFLSMLCHLKYSIFLFSAVSVVVMSLFVLLFLPETKNVPIEEMADKVWKRHWFWKRFMNDEGNSHSEANNIYSAAI